MESKEAVPGPSVDVPERVFEAFLARLEEAGVEAAVTERLREVLITKAEYAAPALREALFKENSVA